MTSLERLTALEARQMVKLLHGKAKPQAKRSKYGNVKTTTADGIKHDSKKESLRWVLLRQRERDGEIRNLRRQVTYRFEINGHRICKYVPDFVYEVFGEELPGLWTTVVEDVKSPITRKNRAYRIKVKLMAAIHGIQVREV